MALSSAIMHLFSNERDSPSQWASLQERVLIFDTSCGKDSLIEDCVERIEKGTLSGATRNTVKSLFFEEDSGLGMDADANEARLSGSLTFMEDEEGTCFNGSFTEFLEADKSLGFKSKSVKKKLFTNKRIAENCEDTLDISPSVKRFRKDESNLLKFALMISPCKQMDDDVSCIIRAVDRLTTELDLVADGSRDYSLPTIIGKHGDLKAISAKTMADIVEESDTSGNEVMIVDCRYPYEFEGGHIKGAVNLYLKEDVYKLLELSEAERPSVLVFHCEFSSERGPKMYRFLRSCDREHNKNYYPKLNLPEVYLLEGGYKEFFHTQQKFCEPREYKPMLHKDHGSDLRHFRVKSKSWAGGQQRKPQSKSQLSRSCLSFNK